MGKYFDWRVDAQHLTFHARPFTATSRSMWRRVRRHGGRRARRRTAPTGPTAFSIRAQESEIADVTSAMSESERCGNSYAIDRSRNGNEAPDQSARPTARRKSYESI